MKNRSKKLSKDAFDTTINGSHAAILISVNDLRHSAVHRQPTSAKGVIEMINSAMRFAGFLRDTTRQSQLEGLHRELETKLRAQEFNKNFLENKLKEELNEIQRLRQELAQREADAIADTVQNDNDNKELIGVLLEDSVRRIFDESQKDEVKVEETMIGDNGTQDVEGTQSCQESANGDTLFEEEGEVSLKEPLPRETDFGGVIAEADQAHDPPVHSPIHLKDDKDELNGTQGHNSGDPDAEPGQAAGFHQEPTSPDEIQQMDGIGDLDQSPPSQSNPHQENELQHDMETLKKLIDCVILEGGFKVPIKSKKMKKKLAQTLHQETQGELEKYLSAAAPELVKERLDIFMNPA